MTGSAAPLPLPNLEPVRPVLGPPPEIASLPHGDQGHQEGLLLLNTIPGMNPAQGSPPRPARGAGAHPGGRAGGAGRAGVYRPEDWIWALEREAWGA